VIFPHYVLSNKESYFPEPTKFIPERWLKNEDESQKDIHRFVSLPFGYGRRTCIGRRFAEAELAILLSKVRDGGRVSNFVGLRVKRDIKWQSYESESHERKFESCRASVSSRESD
jgi:cytochrome P450 family 49 subfamily A